MKIEHIAFNVADPVSVADWYCRHLGFVIARKMDVPPFTHFLRDPATGVILEIYNNPPDRVPDYATIDPLQLHLAFASDDLDTDRDALLAAGAKPVSGQTFPDGTRFVMLRDPWGLSIQVCQRAPGFFS